MTAQDERALRLAERAIRRSERAHSPRLSTGLLRVLGALAGRALAYATAADCANDYSQEQVMRTYEQMCAAREAARPMDAAWDALSAAEQANKPIEELTRLYDVYLAALDSYTAWQRAQAKRERSGADV